jgi:LmbE family N-acetylglucosaminyl deacetylase
VIAGAVRSWLAEGGGTVAVPAAAGWRPRRGWGQLQRVLRGPLSGLRPFPSFHPDHEFVRDAVIATVAREPQAAILLYEELPYRWGGRADCQARRLARELGWMAERIVLPVDRVSKAARIAAYATQVPHLTEGETRLDDPADLPRDERYWWLVPREQAR